MVERPGPAVHHGPVAEPETSPPTEPHEPLQLVRAAIDAHVEAHGDDDDLREASDHVDRYMAGEEEHHGLGERLELLVEGFEADHPDLARSLRSAAYYLSGSGL